MKSKLPAILVGGAVVGVLGFLTFGSLGDNLVYYWTPAKLQSAAAKATGAIVRLGGLVKPGTVVTDGTVTTFEVTDETGASVRVRAESIPPAMFREGIGVVVEGTLGVDGTFVSQRLMVKHDENYTAPAEGQAPAGSFEPGEE